MKMPNKAGVSFWLMTLLGFGVLTMAWPTHFACQPEDGHLPFNGGWFGADGDVSVRLSDNTSVWIFADTMVGPGERQNATNMPHNSVGVYRCGDTQLRSRDHASSSSFSVEYFWGDLSNPNTAVAFFPGPDPGASYYWVADAAAVAVGEQGEAIYAFAMTESTQGTFVLLGFTMITVQNPLQSPYLWKPVYTPLTSDPSAYIATVVMTPDDASLLLYVLTVNQSIALMSLPPAALSSPLGQFSYLVGLDPQDSAPIWKPAGPSNLPGADAYAVQIGDDFLFSTEFTVRFHEGLGWVAVIASPKQWSSAQVLIASPETPWGPFKQAASYFYPEMQQAGDEYPQATFCYAAKEHPEFESDSHQIVFTYACNLYTGEIAPLLNSSYLLYDPIFVTIQLPRGS